jgi:hypothetical protein
MYNTCSALLAWAWLPHPQGANAAAEPRRRQPSTLACSVWSSRATAGRAGSAQAGGWISAEGGRAKGAELDGMGVEHGAGAKLAASYSPCASCYCPHGLQGAPPWSLLTQPSTLEPGAHPSTPSLPVDPALFTL